jgi:hypothetical protein
VLLLEHLLAQFAMLVEPLANHPVTRRQRNGPKVGDRHARAARLERNHIADIQRRDWCIECIEGGGQHINPRD